jgi:steroid delta-isomerase-like uncharacterized protein
VTRFGEPGFLDVWGEAWSAGEPEPLLRFFAPDARYRDVGSGLTFVGHDEISRFVRFMLRFAPDSRISFESAYGDRDGFAARWRWAGTASGPLRVGDRLYPATGKTFSVPGVAYCALTADGLIASHEDYYDMLDVVRQVDAAAM